MHTALVTFTGSLDDKPDTREMLRVVMPHRAAYCERHEYRHLVHADAGDYKNLAWYYAVQRLRFVSDRLEQDSSIDLVWVLNLDGVITDPSVPVASFAENRPEVVFFSERDPNGLNAGSFMMKRCDAAMEWLQEVIRLAVNIDHCWHEQRAMQLLALDSWWASKVPHRFVPHPCFSSYLNDLYGWSTESPQHWRPGHMVLRLPGLPIRDRIDIIKRHL